MTDKPENPPAYPSAAPPGYWGDPNAGMTLLDYFAGQALAGEMTDTSVPADGWQKAVAWRCYSVARAMLAERERSE